MAPTLFALCNALPLTVAELAWDGPALRSLASAIFCRDDLSLSTKNPFFNA